MKHCNDKKSYQRDYPTISICGLDCGLCPSFYTEGISRCPGCCGQDFFNKHPSCSIITCCIYKHGCDICCDCKDFPCNRYEHTGEVDSFITYRNVIKNFNYIKKYGLKKYIEEQNPRMELLKKMLENYNDGRSKSFFCIACTLLSIDMLDRSFIIAVKKTGEQHITDIKAKAKLLKGILKKAAESENVELKLRKSKN